MHDTTVQSCEQVQMFQFVSWI